MNRRSFLAAAILCPLLLLAYTFVEPHLLTVRHITITRADIPSPFSGKTMVFVSDIHHGPFFSRQRVAMLVEKVNALQPDIIVLGGDYVHREPRYIVPCFEELRKLKAPLGVYGVLGNHDHWEGASLTRKSMREAGIELLDNRALWIEDDGERIRLGGVGDLWEDLQNIRATVGGTNNNDFVVLVSHNPDVAAEYDIGGVDLMLSGHTHGGQVSLMGLWAPLVPSRYGQRFRSGIIPIGETTLVVSNGVGTVTPPVRFFARPEIYVIILGRPPE